MKTFKHILLIMGFLAVSSPVVYGSEDRVPVLWSDDVDCISQTATLRLKPLVNVRTSWEVLLLEDGAVHAMYGTHAFLSFDHDPLTGVEFPLWGGFPEFGHAKLKMIQDEDLGAVFAILESPLGIRSFVCKLLPKRS